MYQKVCGKRMSEHVWRYFLRDPGSQGHLVQNLPETQTCHGLSPGGDEEEIGPLSFKDKRPGFLEIALKGILGRQTEGDDPLLITFTDDPDETGG